MKKKKPNKHSVDYMFIGAHPDDIEINAGGTIAELVSKGKRVCAVVCSYSYSTARGKEAIRALGHLGIDIEDIHFLDLPDPNMHFKFDLLVDEMESVINRECPRAVYTHFHGDTHQDHEAVAKATMVAARFVQTVGMYHPTYPSGRTNIPVQVNLVSFFSEESLSKKLNALSEYKTQSVKYGNEKWINSVEAIARSDSWRYGGEHGCAELFQLSRTVHV